MWHHRRRAAMRAMAEARALPPVHQVQLQNVGQPVSVDRWLEEQNVPANAQQYSQDTWYVRYSSIPPVSDSGCPSSKTLGPAAR